VGGCGPTRDRRTFDGRLGEGQGTSEESLGGYASPLGSGVRVGVWEGTDVVRRDSALTDEWAARIDIA